MAGGGVWALYACGAALRLWGLALGGGPVGARPEVSTPLNAWRRVEEGAALHARGLDPYAGDALHESPLLLAGAGALLAHAPRLLPLLFAALDLLCALLLQQAATRLGVRLLQAQARAPDPPGEGARALLLREAHVARAAELVAAVYLFNPYSVLSCVGMTTTVLNNALMAGALCAALHGRRLPSVLALALATHQALYPVLLILPTSIIIADVKGGCLKCSCTKTLLAFLTIWASLVYLSGWIMGSFTYIYSTYGFILSVPDLKPNIGLFWYFFTEMFEHFRLLFICCFQMNALVLYVIPLTLRFRHEPMLLATTFITLSAIFRPYPCVGDIGFYLSLFPMWSHLFPYMQQKFMVVCTFVIASALGPTVWHLWIYSRSANANFFFGVTLAFATAQIFLITDLLFAYIKREFSLKHGTSRVVDGKPAKLVHQ